MPDLSTEEIERIKQSVAIKLGENIKRVRKQRNLTQSELASMVLSDRQYLYKIESGKVGISVSKLYVIAAALEIDVQDLL
jgi:transcriptional regulator with XRE-family HTH domain